MGPITTTIQVEGADLSSLPPEIQKQIKDGAFKASKSVFRVGGGITDLTYLTEMLQHEELWDIKPGQMLDGKTVDEYRIKGQTAGLILFVDPATSLPVRMEMRTDMLGSPMDFQDDFYHAKPQP